MPQLPRSVHHRAHALQREAWAPQLESSLHAPELEKSQHFNEDPAQPKQQKENNGLKKEKQEILESTLRWIKHMILSLYICIHLG